MSEEVWKPVIGWEGLYEVSDMGRVRSIPRKGVTSFGVRAYGGSQIKPLVASTGYLAVNLTDKGRRQQRTIHSLVLEAFIGPRPFGADSCHNNGKRDDPRLSNLRWDTRRSNHADKKLHGTAQVGEKHGNARLTNEQVVTIRCNGMSADEISSKFNISKSNVKKIRSMETWKHLSAA